MIRLSWLREVSLQCRSLVTLLRESQKQIIVICPRFPAHYPQHYITVNFFVRRYARTFHVFLVTSLFLMVQSIFPIIHTYTVTRSTSTMAGILRRASSGSL